MGYQPKLTGETWYFIFSFSEEKKDVDGGDIRRLFWITNDYRRRFLSVHVCIAGFLVCFATPMTDRALWKKSDPKATILFRKVLRRSQSKTNGYPVYYWRTIVNLLATPGPLQGRLHLCPVRTMKNPTLLYVKAVLQMVQSFDIPLIDRHTTIS